MGSKRMFRSERRAGGSGWRPLPRRAPQVRLLVGYIPRQKFYTKKTTGPSYLTRRNGTGGGLADVQC